MRADRTYIRMGTRLKDPFGAIRTVTAIRRQSVDLDNTIRANWEELREFYTLFEFTLPAGHPWFSLDGAQRGRCLYDSQVRLVEDGVVISPRGNRYRISDPEQEKK
jgi:hypothetical protein